MNSPPNIPDHTLRRPIGRGAYGEVWLARNIMGAPRAVKIVWRRQFDSDRPYEREFAGIQRYEPVSRSADGLVHVLHVGRNDAEGYFYYVMELADSAVPLAEERMESNVESAVAGADHTPLAAYTPRTLRSDLQRLRRLPTADCLRLALDVVRGLARLHHQGLVHRDVKPGNIIFVNGHAKLADIGLVSAGGEARTFVGTEGYIPPEGPGSPVADLYALGVVLYEASTGLSPERFPDVPPEWFADAAGDEALELHEVVLRACEGQRERRYQSAEEMQADLALLQSGQSVRRVRALERRAARAKRFGWAALLIVALAVSTSLVANWRARVESGSRAKETMLREQAQQSLARAESAEREARQQLNAALFEQARALVASREIGHRTRALDAIRRVAGTTNAAELRRVAFAALAQPDLRLTRELAMPPGRHQLVPDPRFERGALCAGAGPVMICSLTNGAILATLRGNTNQGAYLASWSRDGRHLGVKRNADASGRQAELEVWELSPTQRLVMVRGPMAYESFTFHPREPLLMTGRLGGGVTTWNLESGQPVREFRLPGSVHALAWSPDAARFAASYKLGTNWVVAIHDTASVERLTTLECPEPVETIAWHPRGQLISITGANDTEWQRQVRLMDAQTGRLSVIGRHKLKVARITFTGDGSHLITDGWDREMICWNLRTMQRAFTFAGIGFHHGWNADGNRCAAMSSDDTLRFYDFESPICRELVSNEADGLLAGVFSPDGNWLALPGVRQVCVWNLSGDGPPASFEKPNAHRIFFSPDSREFFASGDSMLARWRLVPDSRADAPPQLEPRPMPAVKVPHRAGIRGQELVLTSRDGIHFAALSNLNTGSWDRLVPAREGWGEVSPDGRWLGTRYHYSKTVRVYQLPEVKEVTRITASNFVFSTTFAPDGGEMIVLHRDGADWWDTGKWRQTRHQPGAPVPGSFVIYTPDGRGLWMVTHFRNTGLFDRRTLEPLLLLPPDVAPVAVSPDGRQLAVSVDNRRVQLWDMARLRTHFRELGLDW